MGFPRILSKNNKIYTKLGEYCLAGDSFWIVCHTCQEELQTQDQFWKHIQDEHNFMLGVGLGVVKQEPGGSTRTTTTAATSYCMEVDSTPTGATAATVATAGPSATTMVTLPALSLYHRKYNDDEQHQQQNQQQQQQQQQQRNDQMTVDLHEQQTHHHHQHHHQQTQQQSQQPQQPTTAQRDATELHAVDENTVPTTTTASGIDIKLEPATNLTLPPPQPDDTQAQIVQQSAANATHSGAVVATSGNTNAATPTTIYHLPQVVPPPPPPVPTQHTQPQPQPQPQPQQQVTTAAYPPNSNTAASPSHVTSAAAAAAVVAAAAAAANIMHTTATAVTLPSALSISSVAPSTAMTAAAAAAMLAQQQQQQDLPPKDSNSTTASASSAVSSDDGERWYICDYETCGLKFKYMSRLELHRAVHSKERRFICDLCSASFKQSCNLSTHRKKKHALKGKGMILPQR